MRAEYAEKLGVEIQMDELKELKSKISDMLSELYKEKNKHYPEFNSQESKEFYSFLEKDKKLTEEEAIKLL